MALYDKEDNWTLEALDICREIQNTLKPIFKKALEKEMSHSDFCYMVLGEVESLILEDRIYKKRVNKNI